MVWDYRGRLTKLTDRSSASGAATLVVDYGYDALDRLSSKKITTGESSKIEANVWDDAFLQRYRDTAEAWEMWGHSLRESMLMTRRR